MVRNSLNYVSWKMRAEVAADLKSIFTSATADEAEQRLGEFEAKWDAPYPPISQSWRRNWSLIIPFFDYPPEIRKVIYTTNAIDSVNMGLRKITKNQGSFPSDDALLKLFYLVLSNISQKWTMPVRDWKAALTHFTIQFEDRMTHHYFQLHLHKIPDTLDAQMNAIVGSHLIDTTALRADDFDSFYKSRKAALVKLVERAMGKAAEVVAGGADPGDAEEDESEQQQVISPVG